MRATSKMMVSSLLLVLLIGGGAASATFAQGTLTGTATLNGVQNGSLYDYTIALNNTGTVPIGTFWYAWVPGGFFLPSNPASVTPPTGWTASTPSLSGNYSIEYVASSGNELGVGSSLNFDFSSADTPATLAGNVAGGTYAGTPIGTSYLYETGAFTTPSYEFVVQSVPEPSALSLLATGFLGLAAVWQRKPGRRGASIG